MASFAGGKESRCVSWSGLSNSCEPAVHSKDEKGVRRARFGCGGCPGGSGEFDGEIDGEVVGEVDGEADGDADKARRDAL